MNWLLRFYDFPNFVFGVEDSRLGDKVTWSLDDAFKKINDNK